MFAEKLKHMSNPSFYETPIKKEVSWFERFFLFFVKKQIYKDFRERQVYVYKIFNKRMYIIDQYSILPDECYYIDRINPHPNP